MTLILFLCIKLSVIHFCVSELGYYCSQGPLNDRNEILLIHSDNYISQQLNRKFIEKCKNFYKITVLDSRHMTTRGIAETSQNVINLYVTDYYIDNDAYESQDNIEYAGDINDTIEPKICVTTNKTRPMFNCGEIVKLTSKSVLEINSGDLHDFVTKMEITNGEIKTRDSCTSVFQNTEDLKTVLLCADAYTKEKYITVNIEPLKLHITTSDCTTELEKFKNNILAVLTPKPFVMHFEYPVPVIFYETQYLLPKTESHFPNSMTLVPWQPLKYGFLEFLKRVNWRRVVIISDDSLITMEFENELTKLFNEERIMYTAIRCEEAICDMNKAVLSLKRVAAKIVIANVKAENFDFLIQKSDRRITWLVMDLAVSGNQFISRQLVFLFTLGPAVRNTEYCNLNEKILAGLSNIARTYKHMPDTNWNLGKLEFYRKFAQYMRSSRRTEWMAFVNRVTKHGSTQEISSMLIDETGVKAVNFSDPFKNTGRPPDVPDCYIRSNNYFKPCDDILMLVLMFVITLFTIILLLIPCYFHKTSPIHGRRYQHF